MVDNLEGYREFWNRHALHDPLWAILSDPSKRGRKWDLQAFLEEFFRVLSPGGVAVFQLPSHARPLLEQELVSKPMSEDTYRATVTAGGVGSDAEPGSEIVVTAEVRNESAATWEQDRCGPIRVGNHWLAKDGRMLIQDDGRAMLPARLEPGASCRVCLTVTVPIDSGEYLLELDVVHEGVTWFGDRGSRTFRQSVVAGPGRRTGHEREGRTLPAATRALHLPNLDLVESPDDLPMHGVPREQVERLIRERGGELLHVERDDRGGREWAGYRYFARKHGAGQ